MTGRVDNLDDYSSLLQAIHKVKEMKNRMRQNTYILDVHIPVGQELNLGSPKWQANVLTNTRC
jgi:hypothetical protein